jgi:hypothetical protein
MERFWLLWASAGHGARREFGGEFEEPPCEALANGFHNAVYAKRRSRKPKLTDHQKREAIKRRYRDGETLAEIGRSYNVSGWTIGRLE